MKRTFAGIALALTLAASGCGGSSATGLPEAVQPKHNGAIIPLADGKGFVELVVQPDNPKAKVKSTKGRLIAVFTTRDGGPADPAPTDVSFTPEGGKLQKLSPQSDGSTKATFESEPGAFLVGREVNGELSATFQGQASKTVIATR